MKGLVLKAMIQRLSSPKKIINYFSLVNDVNGFN